MSSWEVVAFGKRINNSQRRSTAFPPDTLAALDKLAAKTNTTTSELIRGYVAKGMAVDSYKEEMDLIAVIVRQEIKSQLDIQINRLAKMNMKVGKISAGLYYLVMRLLLRLQLTNSHTLKELATYVTILRCGASDSIFERTW